MARFQYQARSMNGKISNGVIDARDEVEAKVKLRARQLMPISLKVAMSAAASGDSLSALFEHKVKSKDLQIFTRQFATLINAGIPIVDSLRILSESTPDKTLKESVLQIKASIETGRRLSDSMMAHKKVFDTLYCNMVKAGEEAGILDTILNRLSTYAEKNEKIKNQVKGALVMPAVIVVAAVLIITAIIVFIIPKFQELYKSSGKGLPAITQILVDASELVRNKWYLLLGGTFIIIYGIIFYISSEDGKKTFDKIMINSPVFGDVIQKSSVARLARTLSTLLSSGVNMLEAIDIAANTAGNHVIEMALKNCKEAVSIGKPFHLPLSRQKEIPQMVAQMVAIGEQTGSLDTMLAKIADFYEDEVENAVRAMTSLIEPFMMIVLGGIIAFILVAMYMPVFQMGDTIG